MMRNHLTIMEGTRQGKARREERDAPVEERGRGAGREGDGREGSRQGGPCLHRIRALIRARGAGPGRHSSRDLAELLSVLSHDLRNPLTAMVWNVPALRRSLPEVHAGRRPLEVVARSNEEIARMLDDMSDAARVLLGELSNRLRPEPCDFAALVTEAVEAIRPTAEARQLALSVEIVPGLAEVVCDRDRVARVLSRVLGRAVRVAPKGSAVAVRAFALGNGDQRDACVAVQDASPGVPEEDRAYVFDLPAAATPGGERRPRASGQGLSLFVARGVIEAHGGRIWVEGSPGASRFVFTLPVDGREVDAED